MTEPFFTTIKVSFYAGFALALPVVLLDGWLWGLVPGHLVSPTGTWWIFAVFGLFVVSELRLWFYCYRVFHDLYATANDVRYYQPAHDLYLASVSLIMDAAQRGVRGGGRRGFNLERPEDR